MEHEIAKAALANRSAKVDAVAELIETQLTLLGATAIEDKLQEVREAVLKAAWRIKNGTLVPDD